MDMNTKRTLVDLCARHTEERLKEIMHSISVAQEGIESDTKSSAGDKYETSRELIQQDLSRLQEQLHQTKRDRLALDQLVLEERERAGAGTVVVTEKLLYFIAISLGKLTVEDQDFIVVSPYSPIGKLLIGKGAGEEIHFNGASQKILAVH
ncbi:MAG TPA: hypothetical protein VK017_12300 [Sphingobacterium sp.]|jgi:ElaB/YqjD/DUF883 family membrane-anchored ribosome-binding protein|nr:hypothetical protein [Sphingobacterium sp.]